MRIAGRHRFPGRVTEGRSPRTVVVPYRDHPARRGSSDARRPAWPRHVYAAVRVPAVPDRDLGSLPDATGPARVSTEHGWAAGYARQSESTTPLLLKCRWLNCP